MLDAEGFCVKIEYKTGKNLGNSKKTGFLP